MSDLEELESTLDQKAPHSLDPADWNAFRSDAHALLDVCIDHIRGARDRPVWTPMPEEVKKDLSVPLPLDGLPLPEVIETFKRLILTYPTGNTHPRFFGWVHGAGTAAGMLAEMCAASMNANCGGRDHSAIYVERQVIDWCRQIFNFPQTASGILTVGTSMATVIAFAAARARKLGPAMRGKGIQKIKRRLVGYCSEEAHACIRKSFDLLGLGAEQLHQIPADSSYAIRLDALAEQITQDTARGLTPFLLVGSAGTANCGSLDDLDALADIAAKEELWFHIDGAFGAWARIAGKPWSQKVAGIDRADSLAFDFHKWMSVPYDAGCVLIRDHQAHREAFAMRPDYLATGGKALAGGEPWWCDYGVDLSRGFRALKVWFTLLHFGLDNLGTAIADNCLQAERLGRLVEATPDFELLAPVRLNICCFRYRRPGLDEARLDRINSDIVARLQNDGIAAPSTTTIGNRKAIRVAIVNHRTTSEDIDTLLSATIAIGQTF